jgi:hypothetical protein
MIAGQDRLVLQVGRGDRRKEKAEMNRQCSECGYPAIVFMVWGQPVCLCGGCNAARTERVKVLLLELLK